MKPNRSKVYCADAGRSKILFETEKKAINFIKFNAEEIRSESGFSPTRAYFCISCGGYHVTSKRDDSYFKTRDREMIEVLDAYKEQKSLKYQAHLKRMELQTLEAKKRKKLKFK
jgi:hypothetical protein